MDDDQTAEEWIAVYASRGFESPALIRGDNILVEGIRLPFANTVDTTNVTLIPFGSLPGIVTAAIQAALPTDFVPGVLNGVNGHSHAVSDRRGLCLMRLRSTRSSVGCRDRKSYPGRDRQPSAACTRDDRCR